MRLDPSSSQSQNVTHILKSRLANYFAGLFLTCSTLTAGAGGEEVVVIYNSQMPGSKDIAQHYAAMRQVPATQIFSFLLTTNEVITREEFTDKLQLPLAEKLESARLWKFGKVNIPAITSQPEHTETRVVESKIRYAVLCHGVPLKIAPTSIPEKVAAKIIQPEFRRNEAAVDSELAWLPLVRNEVELTGPLANAFYGTTNRALLHCTNGLLLVSRLDGPSPEIARALVDKAMAAESNGFWGRTYFDTRGLPKIDTNYFLGDAWILTAAEICRQQGFDVETDTNSETWRAWAPMSQIAFYAGWYTGGADGPFIEPQVEFMPGSFAYHLHSFSAETLRSTKFNWCGPLLAQGATCTMGCVYEPYLQLTPNIAGFAQNFFGGWTFGESAYASQIALSWQTTVIGDPLYQPFKKTPTELHTELARRASPQLEWSFNRLMNLDLVHGARTGQLTDFLEGNPLTATSAVLTEKLAQFYEMQGKPSSAIDAWRRALKLNPSPHQRIRLHRILADKLQAAGRDAEAADNWRQLIAESPDDADIPATKARLQQLEQKIADQKK